jgi:hypothetical protein
MSSALNWFCWTVVLVAMSLVSGCGVDVAFIGDPAFEASLCDRHGFERALERAAESADLRARVVWPEAQQLEAVEVESIIRDLDVETVVLSPYLSLLATDLATAFPQRRLVGYYGGPERENLTWVRFTAAEAMREAGASLAQWVFSATGRSAVLLVDESRRDLREEARALGAGYEARAGVPLAKEAFESSPGRDAVRSAVQRALGDGERAVVVLLGSASTWAFELLRNEEVALGVRHIGLAQDPARILFTVRDDLAIGLGAALASRRGGIVEVESVLELAPRVRATVRE